MKIALQVHVVFDVPDEMALEKFGTTDPYAAAREVQRTMEAKFREAERPEISLVNVRAAPLYG